MQQAFSFHQKATAFRYLVFEIRCISLILSYYDATLFYSPFYSFWRLLTGLLLFSSWATEKAKIFSSYSKKLYFLPTCLFVSDLGHQVSERPIKLCLCIKVSSHYCLFLIHFAVVYRCLIYLISSPIILFPIS